MQMSCDMYFLKVSDTFKLLSLGMGSKKQRWSIGVIALLSHWGQNTWKHLWNANYVRSVHVFCVSKQLRAQMLLVQINANISMWIILKLMTCSLLTIKDWWNMTSSIGNTWLINSCSALMWICSLQLLVRWGCRKNGCCNSWESSCCLCWCLRCHALHDNPMHDCSIKQLGLLGCNRQFAL